MNSNAGLKRVRRAEDLVTFVGACQDCRYRNGTNPDDWRCGVQGGTYTVTLRRDDAPCPHWKTRGSRDAWAFARRVVWGAAGLGTVTVLAFALSAADCGCSGIGDLRNKNLYLECMEDHDREACAPLLERSLTSDAQVTFSDQPATSTASEESP